MVDFVASADHRVKIKENEKKDKYLDFIRVLKRLWIIKVTVIPPWDSSQKIGKGTGRLENKGTCGDHSDLRIIKIGQNTEKSPGDLKWLKDICCHTNSNEKSLANAKTL